MRHRRSSKEYREYLQSMVGKKFTFLTVESIDLNHRPKLAMTVCKCGRRKGIRAEEVFLGRIRSCGCLRYSKPETKECYRCKQTLPFTSEFFGNDAHALFKLKPGCKKCNCEERKIYLTKLRKEVLSNYSNGGIKCACCGEREFIFLCLDHVNNDGYQERKSGIFGQPLLMKLKRENYPSGFQVLCYNCNMAKAYAPNRLCPHKIPKN